MSVWLAALGCVVNAAFDASHCESENVFQRCKFSSFVIQRLRLCLANVISILCLCQYFAIMPWPGSSRESLCATVNANAKDLGFAGAFGVTIVPA